MTNTEKLAHWIRHDPDEKQMKAFHELGFGTSMGTKSIYYTCSNCNSWVSLTYNYCPNCGCRKEKTMTNKERKQTGLLHSADELKRLILEHQELPILVLAGDNANIGDYGFMSCSRVRAQEGEFLDCKQKIDACKCYTDRDDFEDDVADFLAGEEQYRDLPDDEFNSLVERTVNEYDDFWKPCILLLVDN